MRPECRGQGADRRGRLAAQRGALRPQIAVIGGGASRAEELRAAEAVGRELGRAGAGLVCGGLGGVMAAACRGAFAEGGLTIGLLPGEDRSAANPWVVAALPTGLGHLRNFLVVQAADAVVALPGASGTLSEAAMARTLGRPLVVLGASPAAEIPGAIPATDPESAVSFALRAARAARARPPA